MNEEQKAFVNELLKKDSIGASANASTKRVYQNVPTDLTYNGKPVSFMDLYEYIRPSTDRAKNWTKLILLEILGGRKYDAFNRWTGEVSIRRNTYIPRLYEVVKKLVEENEPHRRYNEENRHIEEIPLTIDDLETTKNEEKPSTTDGIKTSVNEEKSFRPDEASTQLRSVPIEAVARDLSTEEILIENEEKSSTIDGDKTSENEEKSSITDGESINSTPASTQLRSSIEAVARDLSTVLKNKDKKGEKKKPTYPIKAFNDNYDEASVARDLSTEEGPNEDQLFKNIELALSYKDNPEYMDKTVFEYMGQNGRVYPISKPSDKLRRLVHQQIAEYMKALHKAYGSNISEYITRKKEIIDKINKRYFRDNNNNEFGWVVYGDDENNRNFEIKDLKSGKLNRRAYKRYLNQDAPNKFTFFVYNMKDIYSIIEEYYEINLSVNSKHLIESIVHTSVDNYIKRAKTSGQIAYHTISHGTNEDVIKLIEKYINSKRNIHIKMKFEFDSDARSKLMEVIQKEVSRNSNDYKQKSKNIMSYINSLKFS